MPVTRVAAQRLVDAGASLEPADRSLLNLMINHGLDDEAVGRLTQMSSTAIASRREHLIAGLGEALGLPPATVRDAVEELAVAVRAQSSEGDHSVASTNHAPAKPVDASLAPADHAPAKLAPADHAPAKLAPADPAPADPAPTTLAPADLAPADHAPTDPRSGASEPPTSVPVADDTSAASRRRRLGVWALVVAALAIAVVLAVILASGSAKHRGTAGRKVTTPVPAAAPAPQPAVQPEQGALSALAGGPTVAGSVTIVGPPSRWRLHLIVSGLPSAGRSHYELWLYNSIIDAVPLARIGAPGANIGVALPPGFRHYRWLDISRQPPGSVNHSGESVARAAVPG